MSDIKIWISGKYYKAVNSIAFFPAILALSFLVLSYLSISFDFSETGQQLKSQFDWLKLRDASTARSIISSVTAGIISLTVFSFSMVMIVLNQTASQMSNRILNELIGSRYQQIVLGIYVGTIVYSLFLLSSIRDIDSGLRIPVFSTYLLMLFTVLDVFLFIYFLHYITQSVKYEVIIRRIYAETKNSLKCTCTLKVQQQETFSVEYVHYINSNSSGVYEGFDKDTLISICSAGDCSVFLMHTPGTYILKGFPVAKTSKKLSEELSEKVSNAVNINESESISKNYFYGLRQLTEVAIKALSPGINDPATAIESLRALFRLYAYRIRIFPECIINIEEGDLKISTKELTFEKIFSETVLPVWDYGKDDRMIQNELHDLLIQLKNIVPAACVSKLLFTVKERKNLQYK